MRISTTDIPVLVDIEPVKLQQQLNFGDASAYGMMACEHMIFAQGTDNGPLMKGLKDDACQSPHWGYVISGDMTVSYTDGTTENIKTGDMFYFPPGHSVRANAVTELALFSPQHEHCAVINHVKQQLGM